MPLPQPEIAGLTFDCRIIRSKRKTLAIHIKNGQVEVRAPARAPKTWIGEFIREKTPWIKRQLAEQREKIGQRLVIANNRQVSFLGEPRTIQVILSTRQKVQINDDFLFLFTRNNSPRQLESLFHRWLMEQAREYLTTRTIKTARQLGVEHKLKEVVFRKTKSKWGHCCHDGTIQYNWLAMMAPRPVVDYLVAHETSHLKVMNHSAKFWSTVASVCPDYQTLKNWLKDNGHRFWTAT